MNDTRPIGVFDSGIGGLTVLKAIHQRAPEETLIYLGDTARVPYGSKSKETVLRYSRNNVTFLRELGVKMVVIACNTASAYALPELVAENTIPIIGVVEGGVDAAVAHTKGVIGVIGTEATVNSGAYSKAIKSRRPEARVISVACPMFVPLVEEGWTQGDISTAIVRAYLDRFKGQVDTLVLGCTHYPLLKEPIALALGPSIALIDSAEQTALKVKETLDQLDAAAPAGTRGGLRFMVTDSPARSKQVGERMLGGLSMGEVELVDI